MKARVLPEVLSFGDVLDVENFVQNSITKSRVPVMPGERAELVAEGLAIMWKLWTQYDPAKDGGGAQRVDGSTAGVASFAGYANFLLGRRLSDAWHRMHEHHVREADGEGGSVWVYRSPHQSWERLLEADGSGRLGTGRSVRGRLERARRVGEMERVA